MTRDKDAVLTRSQRRFVRGEDVEHDRQTRQRIRERLSAGVKDFALLYEAFTTHPGPNNLRQDDLNMVRREVSDDQINDAIAFLELFRDEAFPENEDLERRVDRMENRLDGIEALLERLVYEEPSEPEN